MFGLLTSNFKNNREKFLIILYAGLLLIIISLGVFFRIEGYFSSPLWLDEAWRANFISDPIWIHRLMDGSAFSTITSIGYILINIVLIKIGGNSEPILRLSSLIPSILSMLLVILICRELIRSKFLIILSTFITAFNPQLISYAKELKPYSLELFLHLLLIYMLLIYIKKGKENRYLVILMISTIIAVLVVTNIVFILPTIFIITIYQQYENKRSLVIPIVGMFLTALLILMQNFFIWSRSGSDMGGLIDYWKNGFYFGKFSPFLYAKWLIYNFISMNYHFLTNAIFFKLGFDYQKIQAVILSLLYMFSVIYMSLKKRYNDLILFVLPVLVVLFFNSIYKWPFGFVRVNIFMFGYFLWIIILGLSYFCQKSFLKPILYIYIFVFILLIQSPYNLKYYKNLTPPYEDIKSALNYIYYFKPENHSRQNGKNILCINNAGANAFTYYTLYHNNLSKKYKGFFRDNFKVFFMKEAYIDQKGVTKQIKDIFSQYPEAFILYTHIDSSETKILKDIIASQANIIERKTYKRAGVFLCESKIKINDLRRD